ncbi:PqqD family protein [Planctomycetota bacterium]
MMLSRVYKKNPDFVTRVIADELVLVPVRRTAVDLDRFFVLNDTAQAIWKLIDGQRSLNQIKAEIIQEFDVDEATAQKDMDKLIRELEEIKGITRVS